MNTMFIRTLVTKTSKFPIKQTLKGRAQNWKSPVYVAPHVNPLQVGPDYAFQDGTKLHFTSKIEVDRKKDQIELGKTIVKYLAEIKEMEAESVKLNKEKMRLAEEHSQWTPIAKGRDEIY
uniref:39S ribosomal protein L52, mitochondrial n=1 Tax=Rhabditophanes sp. KR3021 TaxID=114890 RepID=A0AC35TH28_9BILA